MTLDEAIAARNDLLRRARLMAWYAGNKELPWGHRYQAAVTGDHCLEVATECDRLIRLYAEAR